MVEYFRKKRTQKAGTKSKYNSVHGAGPEDRRGHSNPNIQWVPSVLRPGLG